MSKQAEAMRKDGWVEIPTVRRVRMWTTVPEAERATDDEIMAAWAGMSPHYRERERERLAAPGPCKAAVRGNAGGRVRMPPGKWVPCGGRPAPGADLCAQHGGPTLPKKVPQRKRIEAIEHLIRWARASGHEAIDINDLEAALLSGVNAVPMGCPSVWSNG